MGTPLTKTQIIALAVDARKAFDALPEGMLEALRDVVAATNSAEDPFACAATVKKTELFDAWRRLELGRAMEARGKRPVESFKALSQGDFLYVRAHFTAFVDSTAAGAMRYEAERDEAKRFRWVIKRECDSSGFMSYPEYPENICRAQFKCGIDDAGPAELRKILYTVRNRARAKKQQ